VADLFAGDSGPRAGFVVFYARVSLRPTMKTQDLATAGPSIATAAQQYGS
jgi:hypothetical protein